MAFSTEPPIMQNSFMAPTCEENKRAQGSDLSRWPSSSGKRHFVLSPTGEDSVTFRSRLPPYKRLRHDNPTLVRDSRPHQVGSSGSGQLRLRRCRRDVTMAEHLNVYHPGREVASRDELRDMWLGPSEYRSIMRGMAQILLRLRWQSQQPWGDDGECALCWRGLESLLSRWAPGDSDLLCSTIKHPSRLVVRRVVQLYRDGRRHHTALLLSGAASASSETQHRWPEQQLRFWCRLLTRRDRQLAERKARMDRLEVLQAVNSNS